MWYHGTNRIDDILVTGLLKKSYGRFGVGVYFSDDKEYANSFGSGVIGIDDVNFIDLLELDYVDLIHKYPYISVEEEEGVTELEDCIVNEFRRDGVIISYENGDREMCIYKNILIKGEI